MAKYSTEFKVKVVKEYLEGNIGYGKLAKKYNIPTLTIVREWVNAYRSLGYEGLKVSRTKKQYSLDFKLNVVNLYLTGEMSYQSLANELKINNPALISRWVKEFRQQGIEGLKPKKKGRAPKMPKKVNQNKAAKHSKSKEEISELDKLREENYRLKMEVAILKKKIQFSQMTQEEIDEYLKSLDR